VCIGIDTKKERAADGERAKVQWRTTCSGEATARVQEKKKQRWHETHFGAIAL
jgi:hypothetical protein